MNYNNLQNDDLIIGEDIVRKILEDIGNAIQEQIKNKINEYKEVTEKQKDALLDAVGEKLKTIKMQGNVSIGELNEKLKSSVDYFDALVQKSIQEMRKETTNQIQEGKDEINKEKERALKEIADAKESGSGKASVKTTKEIYQAKKQALKEKLIKFYKKKRGTVPLSPLVEEISTPLAGFYVMPDMVSVKQTSLTRHQEERTPVGSLQEIFITGSDETLEIYLSADAGFGKTSFSKYLAITWGQACCPDSNRKHFKDEELKVIAKFEFLFLILLRDFTDVCIIDKMIEQEIKKNISKSEYPLDEILSREKCLIILDGLDEWTHPVKGCHRQDEKIPHRYPYEDCTIITTTRPWKLGLLNLDTSEINTKIELVKLNEDSL